jgi:hypothetical protein
MHPEKIPADAKPEIALPAINAFEDGAAPQTADPTSKTTMEVKKTHFIL